MGGYRLLVWFWRTTTVCQTPVSPSPRRSRAGLRSLRSLRPALLLEKEPPQFPHPRPPEDAQPPQGDTIYIPCPTFLVITHYAAEAYLCHTMATCPLKTPFRVHRGKKLASLF